MRRLPRWTWWLVAGSLTGCPGTWEPFRPETLEGIDSLGRDFPLGPDGTAPDPGPDHPGDPGRDPLPPTDGPLPGDPGSGQDLPADTPPDVPDTTPPRLVSAFSTDGRSITVRFSEPMARGPAETVGHYTLIEGGTPIPALQQASLHHDLFVTLTLDPARTINPSLSYQVQVQDVTDLAGNPVDPSYRKALVRRSAYVAIVWHQHQPFYADASGTQLTGPWVRKHATKDYYDMAAILQDYPEVHLTINLTAVMLVQLLEYYVQRLGDVDDQGVPLVDLRAGRVREEAFLAKYRGRTDPWIDLLLDDTPDPEGILAPRPTDRQKELFYNSPWTCLSTAPQLMQFFPEYQDLRNRAPTSYTRDDLLALKIFFEIAWFDPDFLHGPVAMPDGTTVDLSDVVTRDGSGRFRLAVGGLGKAPSCMSGCASLTGDARTGCESNCPFQFQDPAAAEDLANRLVVENYKVMANVVGIHKALRYDPDARTGQIEIATTPFYHPILPLIADTENMAKGQPFDARPARFSYPEDARAQVAKAVAFYRELFGQDPSGMWPGEGSVAESVVEAFQRNGIRWIATDQAVLSATLKDMGQSEPFCAPCQPYRLDIDTARGDGGDASDEMAIVFRLNDASDRMGFAYQGYTGRDAAADFMAQIAAMAPKFGGADRLLTIILDGENAWENYSKEHDGKGFHRALYQALQDGFLAGEVIPVTVSEYLLGNPARNVPAHPVHEMTELEPLWPGSWIGGNFAVWIGEPEENTAWGYLLQARKALEDSGLPRPNPAAPRPDPVADPRAYSTWMAWEEIYAAEGSDWFWWYGDDMTSPANDDSPFDMAFRSHLNGMYRHLNTALQLAGKPPVAVPDFAPIVQAKAKAPSGPFTVAPTLDGKEQPTDEWAEGGLFFDNDSGAAANPDDDIASVKYGYTADAFLVAIASNEDWTRAGTGYGVAIYLSQKHIVDAQTGEFTRLPFNATDRWGNALEMVTGGAAFEVFVNLGARPAQVTVSQANGSGGWTAIGAGQTALGAPTGNGRFLEVKIPFSLLQFSPGDPLEFRVVAGDGNRAIDPAPNFGGKLVFEDVTSLVYVTFVVDCTGNQQPLDTYGTIANPPPPRGRGIAYIAGNQDRLGSWIPNKIALRDDGKGGDATAGDNLWTGVFGFMPGTQIRYKYTLGIPTDEGRWNGEEFPLTERGFDVTKNPSCKRMRVEDVFADRPQPTGTLGPRSRLQDCLP